MSLGSSEPTALSAEALPVLTSPKVSARVAQEAVESLTPSSDARSTHHILAEVRQKCCGHKQQTDPHKQTARLHGSRRGVLIRAVLMCSPTASPSLALHAPEGPLEQTGDWRLLIRGIQVSEGRGWSLVRAIGRPAWERVCVRSEI
eukprot:scaffold30611_cov35-Tisochrysis_lutea.AAC.3